MIHKSLLITGTTAAVGLTTLMGTGVTSAMSPTSYQAPTNRGFGLEQSYGKGSSADNTTDPTTMAANFKAQLDQAVQNGKLTQDQEDYILQAQQDIHGL